VRATLGRAVDCDVHCAVPSFEVLYPYLPDHWVEFFSAGFLRRHPAVSSTYPAWSPMTAMPATELTLERVRAAVLETAERAILHCYWGVESFTHPYLAAAIATAINRWIEREWLDRDERLLASAVVTPQHLEQALAEVERIAADRRFVQILVPARAPAGYGQQRFWPLWEAAARHGLVIAITFGGGTGTPPTPVNWLSSYFEEYTTAILNFQAHVLSLSVSGLFDRHPELRFVIAESGWTWLPAWLWRMDQEWRAFHREVPWMSGPPSSYVRRHFRFTIQPTDAPADNRQLRDVYDELGSDELLLFSSDFPHRSGAGGNRLLALLTDEQRELLLWRNAVALYGRRARLTDTPRETGRV
jgi:predicted TIM-barrel fold metal-dependent hydrolase